MTKFVKLVSFLDESCVEDNEDLTLGKVYEVFWVAEGLYGIENDVGDSSELYFSECEVVE